MKIKLMLGMMLMWLIIGQSASALSYSPDCAEFEFTKGVYYLTESIDKFDPNLGVLTKVTVTTNACAIGNIEVYNPESEMGCFFIGVAPLLSTSIPDGTIFDFSFPKKIYYVCLSGDESYRFYTKSCMPDTIRVVTDDLSAWIGPGIVTFGSWIDHGEIIIIAEGNFDIMSLSNANQTICVTYYYEPCDDNNHCTDDTVEDNKCVHTPVVCNDDDACTDDACVNGMCFYKPVDCDDGNVCNGTETCDPVKGCMSGNPLNCDDNDICNGTETCDPVNGCQAGIALICNDGNDCTTDSCNPATGCATEPIDCDDNNKCTTDECDPAKGCTHDELECDDNNICNGVETCDPATGCTNPDDLACDDGKFCNGLESCDPINGCQDGDGPVVDDGVECTDDSCDEKNDEVVHKPVDSLCSDNDICDGIETCNPVKGCQEGIPLKCDNSLFCDGLEKCDPIDGCQDGADPVPDDGVDCTDDSCDEDKDKVVHKPNNEFCSDENICNGVEVCDSVNGCQAGIALICDDGNDCTTDSCNPATGCATEPIDCDDNNKCTTDECDPAKGCTHDELECDDNNICNGVETCDPATGCTNPDDLACDDGKFCNGLESCDPINGCQDGDGPVVDDGVECTDDSCDETNDEVVHKPVDPLCSDNDICDGIETCNPVKGCQEGIPLKCDNSLFCDGLEKCDPIDGCQDGADPVQDDGVDCTDDSCDEDKDKVVHKPNNEFCSDENICNGVEVCDSVNGCQAGIALICDDGNACTTDSCDPATGCATEPIDCDDNNKCTTDECDPAKGCTHDKLECDDNNICNGVETCDPATGCTNPDDLACDDGKFCNGLETCDPIDGCQEGDGPVVDDGVECTDDSCDEDSDKVVHKPNNEFCSDEDTCNGAETCDPVNGCQAGIALICNDGNACTTDNCDPATGCTTEQIDCEDDNDDTEDSCDPAKGCVHDPITLKAVDDSYSASFGKTLTIPAGRGVLRNDDTGSCRNVTSDLTSGPSSGDLTLNPDGSFTYTPYTGFVSKDTFTYQAICDNFPSDEATVTISVAKCALFLRNDLYTATCGIDNKIEADRGIISNDRGATAVLDPESISIDPKYGSIEVEEDGSFVYHAAENLHNGVYVIFKYRATNGVCEAGNQGTAKIQVRCNC